MSIQQEIILRYKAFGHVRFQIPERLCGEEVARFITDAINSFTAVYRVNLFRKKQKLAIHFTEENLPLKELVQQLNTLFSDLEKKGVLIAQPQPSSTQGFAQKFKFPKWEGPSWAKDKYSETKETAQAISVLAKLGLKKKPGLFADSEKILITFFNDVLVLFLIKVHWKLISKKWIVAPIKYRYQWLTIFYLMFLFIRSKTTKNK